jgi:hypothetical protein
MQDHNIRSFLEYKKDCPFCKKPLNFILDTYLIKRVSTIKSFIKDNICEFEFRYNFEEINCQSYGKIDIYTRECSITQYQGDYKSALKRSGIHAELYCRNKSCNTYNVCSSIFSFDDNFMLKPINIQIESVTINKFTLINYVDSNYLEIYRNTKNDPIIYNGLLDFNIGKRKMIKKINTIVMFS